MRKNTFFGAAALGVAGIFLIGGVANADLASTLHVADKYGNDSVLAGDTLTLSGTCLEPAGHTVRIQSPVFAPLDVRLQADGTTFSATTQVGKDAKPGNYKVSLKCGDKTIEAGLGIVSRDEGVVHPKPAKKDVAPVKATTPAVKQAQVAEKPKGAAETGEGDVVVAQSVDSGAPGAGVYALGGAALLATGGAGVFAFRRLRKQG